MYCTCTYTYIFPSRISVFNKPTFVENSVDRYMMRAIQCVCELSIAQETPLRVYYPRYIYATRISAIPLLNGSQESELDERKRFCTSGPEVVLIFQTPTKTVSVMRNTNERDAYIYAYIYYMYYICRCGLRRDFQRLNGLFISTSRILIFLLLPPSFFLSLLKLVVRSTLLDRDNIFR